jgi:hypothetical protein
VIKMIGVRLAVTSERSLSITELASTFGAIEARFCPGFNSGGMIFADFGSVLLNAITIPLSDVASSPG